MSHVCQIELNNFNGGKTLKDCKKAKIHWNFGWQRLRSENLPHLFTLYLAEKKLVKMKCTFSSNFSLQKNAKKSHLRQFVSLKMSKIGFRRFQTIRLDRFPRYLLLPLAVAGLWKSQSLNSNISKMVKNRDLKVLGPFSPICCLKNLKKNHLHIWSHIATIGKSLELKIWPWFFGRFFWCENFPTFELLCLTLKSI